MMIDKPVTTYIVSVLEKPHWRTVLTTKDRDKALAMAKEIGDKVEIEEIAANRRGVSRHHRKKRGLME